MAHDTSDQLSQLHQLWHTNWCAYPTDKIWHCRHQCGARSNLPNNCDFQGYLWSRKQSLSVQRAYWLERYLIVSNWNKIYLIFNCWYWLIGVSYIYQAFIPNIVALSALLPIFSTHLLQVQLHPLPRTTNWLLHGYHTLDAGWGWGLSLS